MSTASSNSNGENNRAGNGAHNRQSNIADAVTNAGAREMRVLIAGPHGTIVVPGPHGTILVPDQQTTCEPEPEPNNPPTITWRPFEAPPPADSNLCHLAANIQEFQRALQQEIYNELVASAGAEVGTEQARSLEVFQPQNVEQNNNTRWTRIDFAMAYNVPNTGTVVHMNGAGTEPGQQAVNEPEPDPDNEEASV